VDHAPVPVIAVGNLVAGGTGKTPLVEHLARRLIGMGKLVAVVSRGYGRSTTGPLIVARGDGPLVTPGQGGDEPVLLAKSVPGLAVVVAERRAEGARLAVAECGAEILLLDDGFQHRSLHRDLEILVLDSRADIRAELPLPAGMRREALAGIGRAHLIGWSGTKGENIPANAKETVSRWFTGQMFGFRTEVSGVRRCGAAGSGPVPIEGKRIVAFSGIGNPGRFTASVRSLRPAAVIEIRFRDHHAYRPSDIDGLIGKFLEFHGDIFLTTEKDAVRLEGDEGIRENFVRQYPLAVLGVQARVVEGDLLVAEALQRVVQRR
jgi:tetraacyldisaccharide 4'-kinase